MATYIISLCVAVFFFSLLEGTVTKIKNLLTDYDHLRDFFFILSLVGSVAMVVPSMMLLMFDKELCTSVKSFLEPIGLAPVFLIFIFISFLAFILDFQFSEENQNKAIAFEIFVCLVFIFVWVVTTHSGYLFYFIFVISSVVAHFLARPVSGVVAKKLLKIKPKNLPA